MNSNLVVAVMIICTLAIIGADYYIKRIPKQDTAMMPAYTAFCRMNGYKGATVQGDVLYCVKAHPEGMMVPYDKNVVPTPQS